MKPQVVSVQVGYVIFSSARVIYFDQRVARLCEDEDKDAVSYPSLDEKVDVLISQELKLHFHLFQKSVPAQARRAKVVRQIQPLLFRQTFPAEVFEDIRQQQHVRPVMWHWSFTESFCFLYQNRHVFLFISLFCLFLGFSFSLRSRDSNCSEGFVKKHLLWLWPQSRPESGWCTE